MRRPDLANTIIVMASLEVARMIILESFLSFLGLGIRPPTPSWGAMGSGIFSTPTEFSHLREAEHAMSEARLEIVYHGRQSWTSMRERYPRGVSR